MLDQAILGPRTYPSIHSTADALACSCDQRGHKRDSGSAGSRRTSSIETDDILSFSIFQAKPNQASCISKAAAPCSQHQLRTLERETQTPSKTHLDERTRS